VQPRCLVSGAIARSHEILPFVIYQEAEVGRELWGLCEFVFGTIRFGVWIHVRRTVLVPTAAGMVLFEEPRGKSFAALLQRTQCHPILVL
jgi:hypothetical protein